MAVQSYRTILEEVQSACRRLSILVPNGVYDSQDENALLMGDQINLAGEMVLSAYPWQQFRDQWEIIGDGTRKNFDIPVNYHRLVDDTGWSHAMRRPCRLVTDQQWAYIQAWVSSWTLSPIFRLINNQFQFFYAPAVNEKITFQYTRKNWVIDADSNITFKDFCNKNGDIPMFDWNLMVLALKVKWRETKGFDTATDMTDFLERASQLYNKDVPGAAITLGGYGEIFPYVGPWNLPNTGYGA